MPEQLAYVPRIATDTPWANLLPPIVYDADLTELEVRPTDTGLGLHYGEADLGRLGAYGLEALATKANFPVDFVQRLSNPELTCAVVNDRLKFAREQGVRVIAEEFEAGCGDNIVALTGSRRDVLGHGLVAQVAHDALLEHFGEARVDDEHVRLSVVGGHLNLRLLTPRIEPVTRRKGDALQVGINIQHDYGQQLAVELFTNRLICLNGMVAPHSEMEWTQKGGGSEASQIAWLREGIGQAAESFGDLLARAQRMAETPFEGQPRDALRERLRAMGVPKRLWDDILKAFDEEPGGTEWELLNAVTRYATHHADSTMSPRLQRLAGSWVAGFDLVTARLPRPVAHKVGAHILDEGSLDEAPLGLDD